MPRKRPACQLKCQNAWPIRGSNRPLCFCVLRMYFATPRQEIGQASHNLQVPSLANAIISANLVMALIASIASSPQELANS